MGAWDLWNMAIIPSLLNNSGVWTEIDEKTVLVLEELQNTYARRVLHVPLSTPKVSLRSETGLLSMKHRIWEEKVRMVMAIKEMGPEFLARRVFEEQLRQGFPGLSQEVATICEEIGVEDVNVNPLGKGHLSKAIREHHKGEMVNEMGKKMADLVAEETGYVKGYMKQNNIEDSRTMFRYRIKMLELKENMKGRYGRDNLGCEACSTGDVESQSHVLQCSAYEDLREGLDLEKDQHMITYFREVLKRRLKK